MPMGDVLTGAPPRDNRWLRTTIVASMSHGTTTRGPQPDWPRHNRTVTLKGRTEAVAAYRVVSLDRNGGAFETVYINVAVVDADRIKCWEFFDVDDIDGA